MARLGKFSIKVKTESTEEKRHYRVVDFVINVNMEGLFTSTLDEDQAFELEQSGIVLGHSGRRNSRIGYFQDNTKDGLIKQISDCYKEMYSRELVEETKILRYCIATNASYGFTEDGIIIPNLAWTEDGKPDMTRHWQGGTISSHASDPHPTGIQLYINPLYKRVYKYKSGKNVTEYERDRRTAHHTDVGKEEYNWCWLANIMSTMPSRDGKMREIEYTEQRAKFFVDMYKTLCKMASVIAKFEEPEEMKKLADSGGKLLLN